MAEVWFKAGINYAFIHNNYKPDYEGKQGFLLQGSGGSGKTYDAIFFILTYSKNNTSKGKEILICRETYAACKKTVLKDFISILKEYGMYDKRNHFESHPQRYLYEGNMISFAGRDDASAHGERNDLIYFNEIMLDDNSKAFIQLNSRCREVFIADYNPRFTEHWVYNKIKHRADTKFFKTTFITNKFLPQGEREEKLAFEPTHPEDRHLPKKERRPHPTNIAQGTADEYNWRVYGEGEAAAAEGVIFEHVKWIPQWPEGMGHIHTMDFGFTVDPCVINKYNEDKHNIWIECLSYQPMETAIDIDEYAEAINLNKKIFTIADSSDRYVSEEKGVVKMVEDLEKFKWNIDKVEKTKSVMYWINSMKKKKIHIVKNQFYKQVLIEKENYRLKMINEIAINQPVDKWNHFWDSSRYGHMSYNKPQRKAYWQNEITT